MLMCALLACELIIMEYEIVFERWCNIYVLIEVLGVTSLLKYEAKIFGSRATTIVFLLELSLHPEIQARIDM